MNRMKRRAAALLMAFMVLFAALPVAQAEEEQVLRRGDRGADVETLQSLLQDLGFYQESIDGSYGRGTAAAVEAFQAANGLKADGVAGTKTLEKLYAAAGVSKGAGKITAGKLKPGDSGKAVKQLKTILYYLGYYNGKLTGKYDRSTTTAVKAFQKAKKLAQDGIAGKRTISALNKAYTAARKAARGLPEETAVFLNGIAAKSGAVCGTLVLSQDGKTLLKWSFGGVDEHTCFRIASITKWVTAIGLMTLYDQGKLDLDRDISEYLPFKVRNPAWPKVPITARMLLSHTSSLSPKAQNYHPNWSRIGKNGYDPIFDEGVRPGTQYAYADYNGALFGCLIEAITGESVQNYLKKKVFKPLGLTAAYTPKLLPSKTKTKDLLSPKGTVAISVLKDRNRPFNNRANPEGNNGYTVGKLYINTESLTKLAQMMLAGGKLNGVRILKKETVALMEADQPGLAASKYGLSTVRHTQFPGGCWYGHQGRYSGLSSNIYYQRETGITLALVMNGYDYQLKDNIVMPAVTLLNNMDTLTNALSAGT